jgi:hypothetical protein
MQSKKIGAHPCIIMHSSLTSDIISHQYIQYITLLVLVSALSPSGFIIILRVMAPLGLCSHNLFVQFLYK